MTDVVYTQISGLNLGRESGNPAFEIRLDSVHYAEIFAIRKKKMELFTLTPGDEEKRKILAIQT